MTWLSHKAGWLFLIFALCVQAMLWSSVRDVFPAWANVPPPPSQTVAKLSTLGDGELSYRMNAVQLQNMGEVGGRSQPFESYNYKHLVRWFDLAGALNPHSDFVPFLAAYYFSTVKNPEKARVLADYLYRAGNNIEGEKWRWLAQAVYIARYQVQDIDKALEYAHVLAALENDDMPAWARQMPAFILSARGEKEAAYAILLELLKTRAEKLHPNEVNATLAFMCERLIAPDDAEKRKLCEHVK